MKLATNVINILFSTRPLEEPTKIFVMEMQSTAYYQQTTILLVYKMLRESDGMVEIINPSLHFNYNKYLHFKWAVVVCSAFVTYILF